MASRKRWAIGTVGFLLVAAVVVLGVLGGMGYFNKKSSGSSGGFSHIPYTPGRGPLGPDPKNPTMACAPIIFGNMGGLDPDTGMFQMTITLNIQGGEQCIPTTNNVTAYLAGDINSPLNIDSVQQIAPGAATYNASVSANLSSFIKGNPNGQYYVYIMIGVNGAFAPAFIVLI